MQFFGILGILGVSAVAAVVLFLISLLVRKVERRISASNNSIS